MFARTLIILFIVATSGVLATVLSYAAPTATYVRAASTPATTALTTLATPAADTEPETTTETPPTEPPVSTPVETTPEPLHTPVEEAPAIALTTTQNEVFTVPFYSQFADISSPTWQKVGCGIASLSMLVSFYEPGPLSVDALLNEGIKKGAYLDSAGWTYAGLISVAKEHGLTGESHDLGGSSMQSAFSKLEAALSKGPVMVSVHYTFEPTNPIPHLVIANGIKDGRLYYNDPAEPTGGGSISIEKFQSAWKKRYIEFWPLST